MSLLGKLFLWIGSLGLILSACQNSRQKDIRLLLSEWQGKEILFPDDMEFTAGGKKVMGNIVDTGGGYKIVNYVDSTGCISCKLQLPLWNLFANQLDSICHREVAICMIFSPKLEDVREVQYILRRDTFYHFVCLDLNDSFNQLNHLSSDESFHTFLLDGNNKICAIGNPVLNPAVKDLYLRIIRGDVPTASNRAATSMTTVSFDTTLVDLGHFPWQEPQSFTFTLKNTGDRPLVIRDVVSSCGCVEVEYPEEPVRAGHERELRVRYRAKSRGPVSQSMLVYSNAEKSPVRLYVRGKAE